MGAVNWIVLTCIAGALIIVIVMFSNTKKKEEPSHGDGHDEHPVPHGGGGDAHGGHGDHVKAPTLWQLWKPLIIVGIFLGLACLVYVYWAKPEMEKQEAEELAKKANDPNYTYTDGNCKKKSEKPADDTRLNKRRLMPGVLLLVVVPDGNVITVTHTGGDFYSYIGNDTTDLMKKMAVTYSGDTKEVPNCRFMAYMQKDNLICDITFEVTKENPYRPFEVYDINLK